MIAWKQTKLIIERIIYQLTAFGSRPNVRHFVGGNIKNGELGRKPRASYLTSEIIMDNGSANVSLKFS